MVSPFPRRRGTGKYSFFITPVPRLVAALLALGLSAVATQESRAQKAVPGAGKESTGFEGSVKSSPVPAAESGEKKTVSGADLGGRGIESSKEKTREKPAGNSDWSKPKIPPPGVTPGTVILDGHGSNNCGPGKLCFDYTPPKSKNAAGWVYGTVTLTLVAYQNGVPIATLVSPTFNGPGLYCFSTNAILPAATGAAGFDYVVTGTYSLTGYSQSPTVLGMAPVGVLTGQNNDYQVQCGPTGSKWCCPGKNLVHNGDFEAGNAGFSTDYTYGNAAQPGFYNVTTSAGAAAISPNWAATDHAACNGFAGSKFLVVNGKTTQPVNTWRSIWNETVTVQKGKEYRFCANFRNFPQCTFDVKPSIGVLLTNPMLQGAAAATINRSSNPCDWQLVSLNYTATFTGSLKIDIRLNEFGLGDGNDLALDDISFQEKVPVDSSLVQFTLATLNPTANTLNVTATPTNTLPAGYSYSWQVCEVNSAGTCIGNSMTWTSPYVNSFNGYNGGTPGIFQTNTPAHPKHYRVFFKVWSDCQSAKTASLGVDYVPGLKKQNTGQLRISELDGHSEAPTIPNARKRLVADMGAEVKPVPAVLDPNAASFDPFKAALLLPRAEDDPNLEIAIAKPTVTEGQLARDFEVRDFHGQTWHLSDLRGKRNVLLTFFPKCFTGGCANHLSSLSQHQAEFDAAETQIIAVSVDPAEGEKGQLNFAERWHLTFPMIPDVDRRLSVLYGAAATKKQLAARMSVFIDKAGVVRFLDTDVHVRTHGQDVLDKMRVLGLAK